MRVAAMYHHINPIEPAFEKALIGLEFELVWHDACRIRKHAVLGDDGITFDTTRTEHGNHFRPIAWLLRGPLATYGTLGTFQRVRHLPFRFQKRAAMSVRSFVLIVSIVCSATNAFSAAFAETEPKPVSHQRLKSPAEF